MNLRRKKRAAPGDSSASSDIAFLLIIYFIVIAGFNVNRGFLLNLPARDSTRLVQKDGLLRFSLDAEGRILFDGSTVSTAQAESAMRAGITANPNLAVMLDISPDAPWQAVVSFVEAAQKLSVEAFSFSMTEAGP